MAHLGKEEPLDRRVLLKHLELHRGSEQVVLRRPRIGHQANLLGNLESDQLGLAHRKALLAHLGDDLLVSTQLCPAAGGQRHTSARQ